VGRAKTDIVRVVPGSRYLKSIAVTLDPALASFAPGRYRSLPQ